MDGVVRAPSAFSITLGVVPSITATQLLVVPRSIPITLAITLYLFPGEPGWNPIDPAVPWPVAGPGPLLGCVFPNAHLGLEGYIGGGIRGCKRKAGQNRPFQTPQRVDRAPPLAMVGAPSGGSLEATADSSRCIAVHDRHHRPGAAGRGASRPLVRPRL